MRRSTWFSQAVLVAFLGLATLARAADDRTTRGGGRAAGEDFSPQGEGAKLVPQVAHAAGPSAASFSPDGSRVVSVGADRTAAVWDVETGVLLHRLLGHSALVVSAAFSPDGKRVVTASIDGSAIIWDPFTGADLVTLRDKAGQLETALFSPDGTRVVTTSRDNAAVWDAAKGTLLFRLSGQHRGRVHLASFSADGTRLVTVADDAHPVIWDLTTGKRFRRLKVHDDLATQAAYSPDGKRVVTAGRDGLTAVWDPVFPLVVYRLQTPIAEEDLERGLGPIEQVAYSRDGSRVATLRADGTAVVWDLTTGTEVVHLEKIWSSVDFSADGKQLLTGGNGTALWSAESGELLKTLSTNFSQAARFSPDGERILAIVQIPGGTAADVYDAETGDRLHRLGGRVGSVSSASFAPSGASILTSGSDHFSAVWDLQTGQVTRRLEGRDSFDAAAFSPDGARIVTADRADGASVWDAVTGGLVEDSAQGGNATRVAQRATFAPDGSAILAIGAGHAWLLDPTTTKVRAPLESGRAKDIATGVFAPDGAEIYTTSPYRGFVAVWNPARAKVRKKLRGFAAGPMDQLAISPDGALLAVNEEENVVAVYDRATRTVVHRLNHPGAVTSVAFSPDGAQLVTATRGGTATVWTAKTGAQVRRLRGQCGTVFTASFSPDGKRVLTACIDGTSRLWDLETGAEQLALVAFTDGTWAVVDREGRFDASNDGDIDGLVWVIDDESYELDQLRAQYYDPGLLSKVLGRKDEPLREVPPLSTIRPPPLVKLVGPDQGGRLEITLEDRGGGIGEVFVTLNGSDISKTVLKKCPKISSGETCVVELAKLPTWRRGASNQVEAFAAIRNGNVRSRGTVREVTADGVVSTDPPDLWVLAIGVSDYSGEAIDLTYPSKDAQRFAEALRVAGERGFGPTRVHVQVYNTAGGDGISGRPARDTLEKAAAWMAKSDPADTVVVFMAGHGVSLSVNSVDDYFYLLPDAGTTDDVVNANLRALRTWSGDQIADALAKVPALKRVVILDTCAAGKFGTASLSVERDLSSDAIRAHARAQERTGAWFLAGAAADKVSYEASRYAEGILTYSLLEGMRGPALSEGDLLYVSRLFAYAEDRVPEYARGVGGIQKPVTRRGEADDFVLGELLPVDRTRIPLEKVRPVVVRASVVGFGGRPDTVGLEAMLNKALRERSSGPNAPIVYWDSDGTSDTWQVTGQYQTLADGTLSFEGFVSHTLGDKTEEQPLKAVAATPALVVAALLEQILAKVD